VKPCQSSEHLFFACRFTKLLRIDKIIRAVRKHRFLSSDQDGLLAGGSRQNLLRRLALLFQYRYLDCPHAQLEYFRVVRNNPFAYGLGNAGAIAGKGDRGKPNAETWMSSDSSGALRCREIRRCCTSQRALCRVCAASFCGSRKFCSAGETRDHTHCSAHSDDVGGGPRMDSNVRGVWEKRKPHELPNFCPTRSSMS